MRDWTGTPSGGTSIRVECKDANYNLSDRQFVLRFTKACPAGTPARNDVVGGSCNGSTLRGITRPRLGTTWQLALDNVPPAATRPFTIVGGGNPACSLNVANSLSLVGAVLHAQGGAFEPTLNAFGAGLSNAIRGVIGGD